MRSLIFQPLAPSQLLYAFVSMSILVAVAAQAGDGATLLAFKAAAIGGGHHNSLLPSWKWNCTSAGGFCSWEGVRCGARHRRVVALALPAYGLTGTLSPAIGNLTFLTTLNLTSNAFQTNIPASIGRLVRLKALDLSYNNFTGDLPTNLSFCASLLQLNLRSNQLHGRIPVQLGQKLKNLRTNQLEGPIPPQLGSMGDLRFLYLFENNLSGYFQGSALATLLGPVAA